MMALDAEPFALVEREGFRKCMAVAVPKYPLPCRTHFSRKVMPEMCDELISTIKQQLKSVKSISFTTDIWTNTGNNEAFISLTAHFIMPDDMTQKNFTLATRHFPETHTASNISEMLNNVMQEWELQPEQLHLILRDNAANIVRGTGKTVI